MIGDLLSNYIPIGRGDGRETTAFAGTGKILSCAGLLWIGLVKPQSNEKSQKRLANMLTRSISNHRPKWVGRWSIQAATVAPGMPVRRSNFPGAPQPAESVQKTKVEFCDNGTGENPCKLLGH